MCDLTSMQKESWRVPITRCFNKALIVAVALVAAEQSRQDRAMSAVCRPSDLPFPKHALARCTYDDPWFYLFTIDGEFQEHERQGGGARTVRGH